MSLWRSVQSVSISEGFKIFIRPCVNWCEQHMGKSRNYRSRWGKFGSCPYQLNLDTPKSCENVEGVSKHHEHSFGLTLNVGYQGGLTYRVKKTPQVVIQLASGIPESYCFGVITKRVGWGAWEWHPPPIKIRRLVVNDLINGIECSAAIVQMVRVPEIHWDSGMGFTPV